jgi:hypothetical protein
MSMPAVNRLALMIEAAVLFLMVIIITMTSACPHVSRKLLRWAARRCFDTDSQRERFQEEWLADLEEVPENLAKLGHSLGVLLFTAAPLWTRYRWERSQFARWMDRATTRPRPAPAVINQDSGAAMEKAGAFTLALVMAGLAAMLAVHSGRLFQTPAAPSGASAAPISPGSPRETWFFQAAETGSGQQAEVTWRPTEQGMMLAARVVGIPVATTFRCYVVSTDGRLHLVATGTTGTGASQAWYPGQTTLTGSEIKSFEVTIGTTPPVVITPPRGDFGVTRTRQGLRVGA